MARPIARRCPCRSLNRREPSQVREYLSWFINRSRDQARHSSAIGAPSRRSQCQARWASAHSLCTPRLFEIATAICREVPSTSSSTSAETAADGAGPKKLDRLSDGVIATGGAGGGAIDPGSKRSSSTASSLSSHPGCHAGRVNGRREVCGRSGTARADGIGGSAVGQYPPPPSGEQYIPSNGEEYIPSSGEEYIFIPPLLVAQEGNTMALTPPVGQAGVPSTPLPSGQVDLLGSTASEALPPDNIPPPFFS